MSETKSSWSFVEISPEAREAAEHAASAAGMDLDAWLAQLIKYTSAMELKVPPAAVEAAPAKGAPMAAPPARPLTTPPMPVLPALPAHLTIAPVMAGSPAPAAAARSGETILTGDRAPAPAAPRHSPPPFSLPTPPPRPTVLMPQRPGGPTLGLSLRPATAEQLAPAPEAGAPAVAPRVPLIDALVLTEAERAQVNAKPEPAPVEPPPKMALAKPETAPAEARRAEPARADSTGLSWGQRVRDLPAPPAPSAPAQTPPAPSSAAPSSAASSPPPAPAAAAPGAPRMVATDMLQPSRFAALASPKEDDIQAALDKWRASGMLEPLIVRAKAGVPGAFEIISGIDRWHAARRAYVRQIPVLVREATDQQALEQGLVDQLRRGPVSPLAEANIYLRLLNDAGLDTERAARLAGKPTAHVATMVRILNLPKSVRAMLEKGEITVMHARALLEAPNPEAIARDIVEKRLDIYQTEQLVRVAGRGADMVDISVLQDAPTDDSIEELGTGPFAQSPRIAAAPPPPARLQPVEASAEASPPAEQPRVAAPSARRPSEARRPTETDVISTELLERNIANALGVRCAISERNGVGVITLHYVSREELVRILSRINSGGTSG